MCSFPHGLGLIEKASRNIHNPRADSPIMGIIQTLIAWQGTSDFGPYPHPSLLRVTVLSPPPCWTLGFSDQRAQWEAL